jgi:hypothetical protein
MNHRILAALLLLTFLLPSVSLAQSLKPSTWGMLKTRYGQQETVDSPGVWAQVAQAVLSDPYLNDPTVKRIWRMVGKENGFVAMGMVPGKVFLVYVSGNLHLENGFTFEPDQPSGKVKMNNALTGELVSSDVEAMTKAQERMHLAPMAGGGSGAVRSFACAGLGAEIVAWGAMLGSIAGPGGTFAGGVIGAGAGQVFYDWCTHLRDPFPLAFGDGPIINGPGETIGHNFGPKGPNQ